MHGETRWKEACFTEILSSLKISDKVLDWKVPASSSTRSPRDRRPNEAAVSVSRGRPQLFLGGLVQILDDGRESLEVGRSESGDGVPALHGREAGSVAARIVALQRQEYKNKQAQERKTR